MPADAFAFSHMLLYLLFSDITYMLDIFSAFISFIHYYFALLLIRYDDGFCHFRARDSGKEAPFRRKECRGNAAV